MTGENERAASGFQITCDGKTIDPDKLVSAAVVLDLGQPDMCTVTIRNDTHEHPNGLTLGSTLTVKAAGGKDLFTGDVVGLDPVYEGNGRNVVVVHGFNVLHRMLRSHRSQTFVDMTDAAIVNRVARNYPFKEVVCGDKASDVPHDHVYQHNQTDLAFLRVRAARLGYEVWVEGNILHFDAPRADKDSQIQLRYGDAESASRNEAIFLKRFRPHLSSAGVVEKVEVRGWDPKRKQEIVSTFQAGQSKLGSSVGYNKTKSGFPNTELLSYEVRQPIYTQKEADALAEGMFRSAAMGYISGEGECRGAPEIRPGAVVNIVVNPDGQDRFNGKYMVIGATHRYTPERPNGGGGYVTELRVERDAEGGPGDQQKRQ